MDERLPMVADRSRAVSLEAHAARIGAYLSAEREQRRENKGRTNSRPRAMSPRRKASRKNRPVICKTLLGADGKPVTFDSVSAAARFVNRQPIHIRKAIKYGWECGGHTWAFQHIAVPQYANQRPVVTDQREHFPSITDAAEAFDTCPENIIRAINTGGTAGKEGRRRRWAYGDEPLPKEWLTNPRIADDGGPANQRAVVSDQGELFNSLTEAADAMGVSDKAIAKAAGNDGRSAGRRWYFTTDYRSRPYVLMALRTRVAPVRIA